MKKTNSRWNI